MHPKFWLPYSPGGQPWRELPALGSKVLGRVCTSTWCRVLPSSLAEIVVPVITMNQPGATANELVSVLPPRDVSQSC